MTNYTSATRLTYCPDCEAAIYPGMHVAVERNGRHRRTTHADCRQAAKEAASYAAEYEAAQDRKAEQQYEQQREDYQEARLSGQTVSDSLDYANRV